MKNIRFFKKSVLAFAITLLPMVSIAQTVTNFTLVNADTDIDITNFTTTGAVSLTSTPSINLRANTANAAKVIFTQGGTTRTETTLPFAFKGDVNGNYNVWAPTAGVYTIIATPYSSAGVAGPAMTLALTVVAGAIVPPAVTYQYQLILGHDGHPDPDDNAGALAGFVAAKTAHDDPTSRVKLQGLIYGDTKESRQNGMLGGASGNWVENDVMGVANYAYFNQYTKPALQSLGFNTFFDIVPQTFNFNATALTSMTTGGRHIAEKVRDAIGGSNRVVYSAGGGSNAAAEAIAWLRNQGYSDVQIKNHFAIIQHSTWNIVETNEPATRLIADAFTMRIEDQNPYSGGGKPPLTVSATKTSAVFAAAWSVAVNSATPSGIANFTASRDASDAGSHYFATRAAKLDTHWGTRGNLNVINAIPFAEYTTTVMNQQMN
jgi:hypothetical protein